MENSPVSAERDCYVVWENCLQFIQQKLDLQAYKTWFEPIIAKSLSGNKLTIEVPSKFFYEYLEENFVMVIREAMNISLGEDSQLLYALRVEDGTFGMRSPQNNLLDSPEIAVNREMSEERFQELYVETPLNQNYTFDNFIEGACNRLARSAGYAVAQKPGTTSFNPLMLYGGVGLGKTHLMQAIGNYVKNQDTQKKVVYVSVDKFTSQFVNYMKNNDLGTFRSFYEHIDVLLIDDVQFLAGKEATQDIFFHIFNHLQQGGKQIVMTSDCPPIELKGLTDRLLSRFKWGLNADLQQPDVETRMAIIQKKLQDKQTNFPEEVVEYLTNAIDSNVRELEGAINSLLHYSQNNVKVTLQLAKQIVQNLVQGNDDDKEVSIDDVIKTVSEYFGVTAEDLRDKTRKKEIVIARQIAMYFAKEFTGYSLKSIGYQFGGRDHSTVIHAIQSVSDYIAEGKDIKRFIEEIDKNLRKNKK
jgi:chromosomal replication initiator protein